MQNQIAALRKAFPNRVTTHEGRVLVDELHVTDLLDESDPVALVALVAAELTSLALDLALLDLEQARYAHPTLN